MQFLFSHDSYNTDSEITEVMQLFLFHCEGCVKDQVSQLLSYSTNAFTIFSIT